MRAIAEVERVEPGDLVWVLGGPRRKGGIKMAVSYYLGKVPRGVKYRFARVSTRGPWKGWWVGYTAHPGHVLGAVVNIPLVREPSNA